MSDGEKTVALVFCAQHPTGLMTARSLRGCGLEIIGFAYNDSPCLRSSIWDSIQMIERTSETIIRAVLAIAACRTGILLLFPADDESVKILSDRRHELPDSCILSLPNAATVDLLLDKSKFYPWASAHGFPVPKTITEMVELKMFEKKLNRGSLAKILGIGAPKLSQILNNKREPDVTFLKAIHNKLGVDGNFILEAV